LNESEAEKEKGEVRWKERKCKGYKRRNTYVWRSLASVHCTNTDVSSSRAQNAILHSILALVSLQPLAVFRFNHRKTIIIATDILDVYLLGCGFSAIFDELEKFFLLLVVGDAALENVFLDLNRFDDFSFFGGEIIESSWTVRVKC
jgi:hypothetical protein